MKVHISISTWIGQSSEQNTHAFHDITDSSLGTDNLQVVQQQFPIILAKS